MKMKKRLISIAMAAVMAVGSIPAAGALLDGFNNSWVLSRRLMAALQGAFHAEYSCLCAAEREESLCRGAKGNLAGAHG